MVVARLIVAFLPSKHKYTNAHACTHAPKHPNTLPLIQTHSLSHTPSCTHVTTAIVILIVPSLFKLALQQCNCK